MGAERKEEDKKKQDGNKPKVDPMIQSIKRYAERHKEKNTYSLSILCQKAGKSISPYEIVSFQECERLNSIFFSCLKSLED